MLPSLSRPTAFVWTALALAASAVLYLYPPAEHSWYPVCPIFALTGWQCPGCGSTRAIYELLHGNLSAAFAWNPLAVIWVPMVAAWLVGQCFGPKAELPMLRERKLHMAGEA